LPLASSSWSQALRSLNLLSSTDEFQVALVKISIACLDATNFVGLANEVAFVRAAAMDTGDAEESRSRGGGFSLFLDPDEVYGIDKREKENHLGSLRARPSVRMGKNDVAINRPLSNIEDTSGAGPSNRFRHRNDSFTAVRRRASGGGLAASGEIKQVSALQHGTAGLGGVVPGVGGYWLDAIYRPELRRLARTSVLWWRGMWIWISTNTRKLLRWKSGQRQGRHGIDDSSDEDEDDEVVFTSGPLINPRYLENTILSQAFAEESEEGDLDYQPSDFDGEDEQSPSDEFDDSLECPTRSSSPSDSNLNHERYSRSRSQSLAPTDAALLLSDISPFETPFLIAHLQSSQHQYLTRTHYVPPLSEFAISRRKSKDACRGMEMEDEARRNCVICMSEPRVIICWPCRCLSLCDECRGSLAARSSGSKHLCPCCRSNVEGYSRIFIP
jgi:hypothetical protein